MTTKMSKPLGRKDRIYLARRYYDLYVVLGLEDLLGSATTETEIVKENRIMDNYGVPLCESQLNDQHKKLLKEQESGEYTGPYKYLMAGIKEAKEEREKQLKGPVIILPEKPSDNSEFIPSIFLANLLGKKK